MGMSLLSIEGSWAFVCWFLEASSTILFIVLLYVSTINEEKTPTSFLALTHDNEYGVMQFLN